MSTTDQAYTKMTEKKMLSTQNKEIKKTHLVRLLLLPSGSVFTPLEKTNLRLDLRLFSFPVTGASTYASISASPFPETFFTLSSGSPPIIFPSSWSLNLRLDLCLSFPPAWVSDLQMIRCFNVGSAYVTTSKS